jgi:hypothetical protein
MVRQTANSEVARFAAARPASNRQPSSIRFSKQHVCKAGTAKSATLICLSFAECMVLNFGDTRRQPSATVATRGQPTAKRPGLQVTIAETRGAISRHSDQTTYRLRCAANTADSFPVRTKRTNNSFVELYLTRTFARKLKCPPAV